jgi:hypothetical protein
VQGIIPVGTIEAYFEVIVFPAVLFQDRPYLVTEVAFYFEYQVGGTSLGIAGVEARICSANGWIQQLVLPDPMAPKMAMPV